MHCLPLNYNPTGTSPEKHVLRRLGCVNIPGCTRSNLDGTACYSPGSCAPRLWTRAASCCTKQLRLNQAREKNGAIQRHGTHRVRMGRRLHPRAHCSAAAGRARGAPGAPFPREARDADPAGSAWPDCSVSPSQKGVLLSQSGIFWSSASQVIAALRGRTLPCSPSPQERCPAPPKCSFFNGSLALPLFPEKPSVLHTQPHPPESPLVAGCDAVNS